jgi:hypothetical protein
LPITSLKYNMHALAYFLGFACLFVCLPTSKHLVAYTGGGVPMIPHAHLSLLFFFKFLLSC